MSAVFFPLDQQLQVWEKHWSERVVKYAVWLSGLLPYAQAEAILKEIGQVTISDSSLWRRAQTWGEAGCAQQTQQCVAAAAMPGREELASTPRACDMGVALDGGMVHIRQEGWKELKVGCVFEVECRPVSDRQTAETLHLAHAVHNTYVAHLGGPTAFGQLLWSEARRRHFMQAPDRVALGDGAAWVWNLVEEHFFSSRQVVDWYHAKLHLSQAAHSLHGQDTAAAQRWLHQHELTLLQGHADRIAAQLHQLAAAHPDCAETLTREAAYFQEHHARMLYLELREDGFPIGSGMVESACKQFRARLAGPGMRWSRIGLERMLPVRAAIMAHRFDDFWNAVYHPPLN